MTLQSFFEIGVASVIYCAAAFVHQHAHAQTDAVFIQQAAPTRSVPSANEVPDYDSDYAAASRLSGDGGNTPEADARPGEYYFLEGARAFRKKEYAFAIQMYQTSASWAYKPAAYNLGVMYARGQGVTVDLPRGMAWIALASERNEQHYVDAREAIYAELSREQFEQANVIWRELKPTYGDAVALRRAKARWAEVRANMTGSRVGSTGNLTVSLPQPNSGNAGPPARKIPAPTASGKVEHNVGGHPGASTVAEILGGQTEDGTTAYRQFQKSDNPYDPKLDRSAFGTTLVGAPTAVKPNPSTEPAADPPDPNNPDPAKHDQ
jgi:hypothetical protein